MTRAEIQDEGIDDPAWHKKEQTKPTNAFDAIMQSKDDCVRRSERYPFMLQVSRHCQALTLDVATS